MKPFCRWVVLGVLAGGLCDVACASSGELGGSGGSPSGGTLAGVGGQAGNGGLAGAGGVGPTWPSCGDVTKDLSNCASVTFGATDGTDCVLDVPGNPGDPGLVTVLFDCAILPSETDAGSTFRYDASTTPNTITLLGEACDRVRAGVERVDVVVGCACPC